MISSSFGGGGGGWCIPSPIAATVVAAVEVPRLPLMSDKEVVLLLRKEGSSDSFGAGLPLLLLELAFFAAPEKVVDDWGAVDGRCCCELNACGVGRIDEMAPGPSAAVIVAAAPSAPAHPPSAWSYQRP